MLTPADTQSIANLLRSDSFLDQSRAEGKLCDFGKAALPALIDLLKDEIRKSGD